MPKPVPKNLRRFAFHTEIHYEEGEDEAIGTCPFCLRENKFYVNVSQQKTPWQCWVCGYSGNDGTFIPQLWNHCYNETTTEYYRQVAEDRLIHNVEVLMEWGIAASQVTGELLIPGHDVESRIRTLYKYTRVKDTYRLMPTPTLGHKLIGRQLFDREKPIVAVCEGPWDAVKLYETMYSAKMTNDGGLAVTANRANSIGSDINVLALPGINTFCEDWTPLFAGKEVWILFDNDHETQDEQGRTIAAGAMAGAKRTTAMLRAADEVPDRIKYLAWGGSGQWTPELPHGFDVRDLLTT